ADRPRALQAQPRRALLPRPLPDRAAGTAIVPARRRYGDARMTPNHTRTQRRRHVILALALAALLPGNLPIAAAEDAAPDGRKGVVRIYFSLSTEAAKSLVDGFNKRFPNI